MKKSIKYDKKEAFYGYLFILPFMLGLGVFNFYAFFNNFYISFTNKKGFNKGTFIGFDNYTKILKNDRFWESIGNTFKYVIICVPAVIILSIIIATLLNTKIKCTGIFRTLIFIPAVTMPAAIGLVWKWMMNYEYGLFNAMLEALGFKRIAWLSDPSTVLIAVSIVLIWCDISQRMIVILAGLQDIPGVYYEAADIDGASKIRQFFSITLPLLTPTIFFVTIMELIGVFQIFDFIYLMIPNGSSGVAASRSVVTLFYEEAFKTMRKGNAAAISMILFVIIMIITIFQMKFKKRWVYEE